MKYWKKPIIMGEKKMYYGTTKLYLFFQFIRKIEAAGDTLTLSLISV